MEFKEHRHRRLMKAIAHSLYIANGGEYCWLDVPLWAKRRWIGKVRKIMHKQPEAWQEIIDAARGRGCNKC
jgi:uncharacterized protein (DUF2461 family)